MPPQFVIVILLILKTWWWVIAPFLLFVAARALYLWWITWEVWYKEESDWILLEIVPPQEIVRPFRAMEDIFTALWAVYDGPNWREIWCAGQLYPASYWFSFEIVSLAGEVHFYIRILRGMRKFFESAIHAQYPDIEFFEAPDYTQNVPQDVPNDKYDLYAEDFVQLKHWAYPIKTYKFFEIRPEEVEAEKRIDPLYNMMEGMAKLGRGEQVWIQFIINPILDTDVPWVTEGRKLANKLAKREEPPEEKSIVGEAARLLATGKMPFEQKEEEKFFIPPEMKLTPGERESLMDVEEKISKIGFNLLWRTVYLYERDAYSSPHYKIARSYAMHFATQSKNLMMYWSKTRTRIHFFFRKRRLYKRKRKLFECYVKRFPTKFPKRLGPGTMIMNAEELATLIHFPSKAAILPPGVPRLPAKKFGPPPSLPKEQ